MVKLPYGRADFASLIRDGYYYVDRTGYIPLLEALGESYQIFLRPRRFGKSLWLSTLAHYYGREHAGHSQNSSAIWPPGSSRRPWPAVTLCSSLISAASIPSSGIRRTRGF
ncbi:MAG: AAA family ATPase [Bacteroidia bacterium]|nr:AAA family ATPase [Bacteroidia bacterium]